MFPYRRMPAHITGLYIFTVVNFLALFHVTLVQGDVLIRSESTNMTVQVYYDLPGSLSPDIPEVGIKGYVVNAHPDDACKDIKGPPASTNSSDMLWFVLIRRYGCNFDEKVLNAQKAGYDAAIVYNVGSNSLERMGLNSDKHIYSVFIGQDDGKSIEKYFTYGSGFIVFINSDLPDINFNLGKYVIPFICIVGICVLAVVIALIIKCVKDYRRRRRHRLSPSLLKKLPIHKFSKDDIDKYDTCAICLEDYLENEKLRILPCAHAYHVKCIDHWLTRNRRSCPICKRRVFPGSDATDSEDDSDDDAPSETTPLLASTGHPTTSSNTFAPTHHNLGTVDLAEDDSSSCESSSSGVAELGESQTLVEPAISVHSVNGDSSDFEPVFRGMAPALPSMLETPIEVGVDATLVPVQQVQHDENLDNRDHVV